MRFGLRLGQKPMLLEIKNLQVTLGTLRLLRDVSLSVEKGSIHGLIGESGCGKSITGMACLGLLPDGAKIAAEKFHFDGLHLADHGAALRGKRICLISQDPAAALNPVLRISMQMDHVLRAHTDMKSKERKARAQELLAETGLPDPYRVLRSYPHELSGGMQQRVVIAQALATGAEFMIADEPTTALDRTTGRQVLKVLRDLAAARGLSVLLISHDMEDIASTCDTATVLYAGALVETGPTAQLLREPCHPYTMALLAAQPQRATEGEKLDTIEGHPPSAMTAVQGCVFADRCPIATSLCWAGPPAHHDADMHHWRCHHAEGISV